jgi:ATP-dependent protease ClpP protease subunit
MLDTDSPGGVFTGAVETAEPVRDVSKSKPVMAYVNSLAASAAYAIAAWTAAPDRTAAAESDICDGDAGSHSGGGIGHNSSVCARVIDRADDDLQAGRQY